MRQIYKIGYDDYSGIIRAPSDDLSSLSWDLDNFNFAISFCNELNSKIPDIDIITDGCYVVVCVIVD